LACGSKELEKRFWLSGKFGGAIVAAEKLAESGSFVV